MAHIDESRENRLKESSALIPEDSWFQDLPHIGNVRPYGMAADRAKAQLLKNYMDGTDSSSPAPFPLGESDKKVGAADG